jgi:uncharacterized RDD family membrane protein YckC
MRRITMHSTRTPAKPAPVNANVEALKVSNSNKIQYAGFWDRFAALIADIVVLVLLGLGIGFFLVLFRTAMGLEPAWSDNTDRALGLVIGWFYFAGMEASRFQATLGKLGIGIMVLDVEGGRVSFKMASWRYVAKLISWVVFFLGFIVAAFTPRKQAFHDFAANTIVVKKLDIKFEVQR